jgi:hypothetical protein
VRAAVELVRDATRRAEAVQACERFAAAHRGAAAKTAGAVLALVDR